MFAAVRRSIAHLCREKESKKAWHLHLDTMIYNADATLFSISFLCINVRYFF